jgi:hypothetical protein
MENRINSNSFIHERRTKMYWAKSRPFLMCIVSCLGVTLFLTCSHSVVAKEASLKGFTVVGIRFDESLVKRPTPTIPRGWRFIGVSNGAKMNSNYLWFQDGRGNVYMLRGFTSDGTFILEQTVQKLNAGR